MVLTLLASLCAAIAAGCVFLLFFDLLRMIEIEKQEDEMHEYKRLPLVFAGILRRWFRWRVLTRRFPGSGSLL